MKSYTIHLLRHGLTDSNKQGHYTGVTDVGLAKEGLEQIKEYASQYNYTRPDLIYTSPLKRCLQTVQGIFEDQDYLIVQNLKECNFGEFEGKSSKELVDKKEFIDWIQNGIAPPGGESNEEFAKRIGAAFIGVVQDMMKQGKTTAVVCTHGGVIMTLLAIYGLPQRSMLDYATDNAQGFTIRITPSVWMRSGMFEVVDVYPKDMPLNNEFKNKFFNDLKLNMTVQEDKSDHFWAEKDELEQD